MAASPSRLFNLSDKPARRFHDRLYVADAGHRPEGLRQRHLPRRNANYHELRRQPASSLAPGESWTFTVSGLHRTGGALHRWREIRLSDACRRPVMCRSPSPICFSKAGPASRRRLFCRKANSICHLRCSRGRAGSMRSRATAFPVVPLPAPRAAPPDDLKAVATVARAVPPPVSGADHAPSQPGRRTARAGRCVFDEDAALVAGRLRACLLGRRRQRLPSAAPPAANTV